jgi:5-methylcytosine-specific restriction endonuclease McrBC regulatory subunit McrC
MVLSEITLEANGQSKYTSYVVPYAVSMSKLFEMYTRAYLKRAGIKSYLSDEPGLHILQYDYKAKVLAQSGKGYSTYIRGNIKPDIILYNSLTDKYLVFDVKYKNLENSRFAREDRLQVLAYALMYNCDSVGIFFPTISSSGNVYYEKNEIMTNENRRRFYNQVELSIDAVESYMIKEKESDNEKTITEYILELMEIEGQP